MAPNVVNHFQHKGQALRLGASSGRSRGSMWLGNTPSQSPSRPDAASNRLHALGTSRTETKKYLGQTHNVTKTRITERSTGRANVSESLSSHMMLPTLPQRGKLQITVPLPRLARGAFLRARRHFKGLSHRNRADDQARDTKS